LARSAKFTALSSQDEVARWLGEVVQEKVAKENAGLVEISVTPTTSSVRSPASSEGVTRIPPNVKIKPVGAKFRYKIEVTLEHV
jgi:hypothetical protein